ncbi:MAG: hypothetical protein BLITH_0007 [Brockia lithotrophica]|uniref:Uncharacterized protein n=1 Tax=Brockia lithotrophica TaxID=933949 RepID=A0A2T5G4R5_9BACL|nr:MAG: hypothetical protein BLITH_0007 [Brockia lithotrophica]
MRRKPFPSVAARLAVGSNTELTLPDDDLEKLRHATLTLDRPSNPPFPLFIGSLPGTI